VVRTTASKEEVQAVASQATATPEDKVYFGNLSRAGKICYLYSRNGTLASHKTVIGPLTPCAKPSSPCDSVGCNARIQKQWRSQPRILGLTNIVTLGEHQYFVWDFVSQSIKRQGV